MNRLFKNRRLVIATMHKKEEPIAPILEKELGVKCFVLENFNSDQFGTFTRDIKRHSDMFHAAKAKLTTAMKIAGCDLGVASEGSFGAHPSIPFIQSNLELTLLIDTKNNLEIRGHHRSSETNMDGKYVVTIEEALEFAKKCGFPEHGIIVRRTENGKYFLYKNISNEDEFKQTVKKILALPFTKKVYLETDMRAHRNPIRMKGIALSAQDLVKNIKSKCPKCKTPGFVITDVEKGLICIMCGLETDLPKLKIFSCIKCGYQEKRKITKYGEFANPGQCASCNP